MLNTIQIFSFQAGIPEEQLIIALESEAAAIYCENLNSEKRKGSDHRYSIENDGSKFMMVDIGGKYIYIIHMK